MPVRIEPEPEREKKEKIFLGRAHIVNVGSAILSTAGRLSQIWKNLRAWGRRSGTECAEMHESAHQARMGRGGGRGWGHQQAPSWFCLQQAM